MPHAPLIPVLVAAASSVALTLGAAAVPSDPAQPAPRVEALAAVEGPQRFAPPAIEAPVAEVVEAATSTTSTTTTIAPPAPTTTAPPPPPPTTTAPPPPPTTAPAPPPPPPPPTTAPPRATTTSCDGTFRSWTNDARARSGLGALAGDGGIGHVPANWSRRMADTNSLQHNPNYFAQIREVRPEARSGAENVGYSTEGARAVFDAFMNSSGHRANILAGDKTRLATACVQDGAGRTWVTMNFWG